MELDLTKPLLSKFWLRGRVWKIQYESLRMICFKCGKFGHQEDKCVEGGHLHSQEPTDMNVEPVNQTQDNHNQLNSTLENDFGSWMMVKKPPPRRRPSRGEKNPPVNPRTKTGRDSTTMVNTEIQTKPMGGSRFEILEDVTDAAIKGDAVQEGAKSSLDNSVLEGEVVDLGKFSQIVSPKIPAHPFNLGNSKNSPLGGPFLGKAKTLQKIKKKSISAPKTFLKDITNVIEVESPKTPFPTLALEQENNTSVFQASNTATHNPTLSSPPYAIDTLEKIPISADNEPPCSPPDFSLCPSREDNRGLPLDGGTVPLHHQSPVPQARTKGSLMDDRLMADAGVNDHPETAQ